MSFSRHQGFFKKAIGSNEEQIEKCKVQQNSVYNMQYNKKSLGSMRFHIGSVRSALSVLQSAASPCIFSLAISESKRSLQTRKCLTFHTNIIIKNSLGIGEIPYRQ